MGRKQDDIEADVIVRKLLEDMSLSDAEIVDLWKLLQALDGWTVDEVIEKLNRQRDDY